MSRDSAGRFVRQYNSLQERYPTGRKHCSCCKRWRLITDFSVAKWEDFRREVPRKLQSHCQCCERLRIRNYTHGQPRRVFNPYMRGSRKWHAFRAERKRLRYHELKKDAEWLKNRREYYRFYHNAIGTYNGNTRPDKNFKIGAGSKDLVLDAKKVAEFIGCLITKVETDKNQKAQFTINGSVMTDDEGRAYRRWRSGRYPTARIASVDAWCIKFGIPLWEIEEFAKITP
jgi:hypothetical protein